MLNIIERSQLIESSLVLCTLCDMYDKKIVIYRYYINIHHNHHRRHDRHH